MIELFSLIAICSIWILGIKIITRDGMILEKLGAFAEKKVDEGKIIYEPLLVCQWCMPSIHTSIAMLFGLGIGVIDSFTWNLLVYYPLVAMGSSLVCGSVWQFHSIQELKRNKIEMEIENEDILIHEEENFYN